ncbi:MAG: APC family permease [Acidobacteriota bacterium]|nr:APC family permease [Acidobacteriota bacterium]
MQAAGESAGDSGHILKRQLGLRDVVLTQILNVVGTAWVGVAAGLGHAQVVIWLAAMLLFNVPLAASVIGLNRVMPLEGGLYVWSREAFGDIGGFVTAWNLWVYSILVTATILYGTPTEIAYLLGPRAHWLPESHWASMAIVSLLVLGLVASSLRGLDVGKWIHNLGGAAILVVFGLLIVLPFWGWARGVPMHWEPLRVSAPPANMRSLALFGGLMFGAFCGLEYVAILAGECKEPEWTIGQSVWIAAPMIFLMFVLGTGSVEAFVPAGQIDFIAPIPETLRAALGNTGPGNVVAIVAILLLEMRLLGAASVLFTGSSRLPMTAGWDSLVPKWFTRLHPRWRTPSNSIVFVAVLVLAMPLAASTGVHAQEAFQLLVNAGMMHYAVTYLAMFAIPLTGMLSLRRCLPAWLKWTSLAGLSATAFSLVILLYPFVKVVNPREYALKIGGTVVLSNLIGVAFYVVRRQVLAREEHEAARA